MSDRHWFEVRRLGRLRYVAPVTWEGVLAVVAGAGLTVLDIVTLRGAPRIGVGLILLGGGVLIYFATRKQAD